jgi:hypothetical protein
MAIKKLGKYELIEKARRRRDQHRLSRLRPLCPARGGDQGRHPGSPARPEAGQALHQPVPQRSLAGRQAPTRTSSRFTMRWWPKSSATSSWNTSPAARWKRIPSPASCLPVDRVIELIFKCTRALDFAHRIGITHRDIKPANILLTGRCRHQDFRLRRRHHRAPQRPHPGFRHRLAGLHVAQQVQELTLDHRTDIYSLGVVMFQLAHRRACLSRPATTSTWSIRSCTMNGRNPPACARSYRPCSTPSSARRWPRTATPAIQTWEDFAHDLAQAVRNRQLLIPRAEFAETEKFDTLRALPFFSDFNDVEIWAVLRFSRWQRVMRRVPRSCAKAKPAIFLLPDRWRTESQQRQKNLERAAQRRLFW